MRVAVRAGIQLARSAITISTVAATANVAGSRAVMP